MARERIKKKGILEFSTNSEWNEKIKKYVIEVRTSVNRISYTILGKKRDKDV